jgi:hypothetical protein
MKPAMERMLFVFRRHPSRTAQDDDEKKRITDSYPRNDFNKLLTQDTNASSSPA